MVDLAFLRALYGALRADELRHAPWPESAKQAFLDSQFALQHRHFVMHFPRAHFLLLERDGRACGRLYLDDEPTDDAHIVDIALLQAERGRGAGSALIRAVQARAAADGRGVRLYVEKRNAAAQRLYERLGFRVQGEEGFHFRLRWALS